MARQQRGSKKIDFVRWSGFNGTANALTAGTLGSLAIVAEAVPETIMRTRGNLVAWMDGTQAPGPATQVAVGMIVVPEGTGSTVLWSPFTDINAPWFYHTQFLLGYEEYVIDVIDAPGLSVYREVIDSKAMRKIPPDSEIQVVFENTTIISAGTVNVHLTGWLLRGR